MIHFLGELNINFGLFSKKQLITRGCTLKSKDSSGGPMEIGNWVPSG